MVEIVESFQDFAEVAEHYRLGAYQIRDLGEGVEIRIRAGRFGYIGIYDPEDPEFERIKRFCSEKGFIKIRGTVPDDQFFTATVIED